MMRHTSLHCRRLLDRVSGLTSGLTTWLSIRNQERAGQLAHELSQRHDLYKDFIVAVSKISSSRYRKPMAMP